MIQVKDLQNTVEQKLDRREIKHNPFLAQIVSVHGSVFADNRPNYVWIAESNQPESRHIVFNNRVSPVEGLNVWVRKSPKPPFQLEIDGVYISGMLSDEDVTIFSLPNHAPNHQYPSEADPGFDKVLIYQPAIQILKTTGNGTNLTVTTQPYIYYLDGVREFFSGFNTDLSVYLPTAGNDVGLLIYLNLNTGNLAVDSGTEVPTGNTVTYPIIPDSSIPSAYVLLQDGQTQVTTATHIIDVRDFLSADRGDSYEATQIGQFLVSVDGATFTAQLPMVGVNGVMVNSDGLIVLV